MLLDELKSALHVGTITQADVLRVLGLYDADRKLIEAARAEYASDDISFDDMPLLSKADDGTWVSAWVWIANQEQNNETE